MKINKSGFTYTHNEFQTIPQKPLKCHHETWQGSFCGIGR